MADFVIKAGTTAPYLPARLEDIDGNALDLTNATVLFSLYAIPSQELRCSGLATILVADPGQLTSADQANVEYRWQPGDTDLPGLYGGEWLITEAGQPSQVVPGVSYTSVSITRRAGG